MIVCELLEVIAVHRGFVPIGRSTHWRGYYYVQYDEGGRFLTLIDEAAGKLRLSRAKLGSFCGPGSPPACYTSWAAITSVADFLFLEKQRFAQIL
jgi:hypothetical protein